MTEYDGNKPARWEDCPWVPTHIRHQVMKLKIRRLRAISQNLIDLHNSRLQQVRDYERKHKT